MTLNLATMLRESRRAAPDKTLCLYRDRARTYADVDESSGRLASGLLALGLHPGDAVAVQLPNVPQFLDVWFGILKAGLVMVPLNPLLKAPELDYHLQDSGARLLVTHDLFLDEAWRGAQFAGGVPTYVLGSEGGGAERPAGAHDYDELVGDEDDGEIAPTNADDVACLIYTSGTTGRPKGAMLTHVNLYLSCTIAGDLFERTDADIGVAVLPLFHIYGLSTVLNVTVRYGGTLVLLPRFDPVEVLDTMERHRCTIFNGVPTMYYALLQAGPGDRDLSAFRLAGSGGAAIPGETIRAFEAAFPTATLIEGYGMSETSSTATTNASVEERRVQSIGRAIWGTDVRVVGPDGADRPRGPEGVGEILVRGPSVMKGYHGRPEETAQTLRNGWLHTGDLAWMDTDGYLYIVDRIKDLIIRGGYNVYPREVEEVLFEHPAVLEAAVIGRPDERLGEEVVAVVAFRPGSEVDTEALVAWCRERLAAYKYPREVRVVDALPKGPSGKILKKQLR